MVELPERESHSRTSSVVSPEWKVTEKKKAEHTSERKDFGEKEDRASEGVQRMHRGFLGSPLVQILPAVAPGSLPGCCCITKT